MPQLAVVLWNQDEMTKAATTMHVLENEPKPEDLSRKEGKSICEFFKIRNIPIEQYMEMFPGCIIPVSDITHSWDSQLLRQDLPSDQENMRKLATLIEMPISVFVYFRHHDKTPRFLYRVG